jgi:hypothetical protein
MMPMAAVTPSLAIVDVRLAGIAVLGIAVGVWLLVRGFGGYRTAGRIGDLSTSSIGSIALGEVRVSGVVEAAELELVSPIQSSSCVYYRSRIEQASRNKSSTLFEEERSVGFRIRDATGSLRVFPRGARWDVPDCYHEGTGLMGDTPAGLDFRQGPAVRSPNRDTPTGLERELLVANLLSVHAATSSGLPDQSTASVAMGVPSLLGFGGLALAGGGARDYREARVAPGDAVTIIGTVLPFHDLPDPTGADEDSAVGGPFQASTDPEIAADLAAARADGRLETDPAEAWGNAAIPGFGIGRPVTAPELDPAARPEPLASPETAAEIARTFDLRPETLILAVTDDSPLLIAYGTPGVAEQRGQDKFLVGLGGALLSIASAIGLAFLLTGRIG